MMNAIERIWPAQSGHTRAAMRSINSSGVSTRSGAFTARLRLGAVVHQRVGDLLAQPLHGKRGPGAVGAASAPALRGLQRAREPAAIRRRRYFVA